ncbi:MULTISPECIES: hypothetical protein [unclassified Aliiroseovarius]|uniref:hypothetical protein n=1 Tax=unclassified Aliiroseovarius TaxID=2623558 RepID=UPI00156851DE|nr:MULTISPECIES: hypothetical protein [unclassified Aliiroseovarius]NRP31689.1 hypothetical protein [Aliiroseovarius sp. xm-m-314]NRP81331.1 hypothetical protein [Aliiroseovarius sp. xm-v-209]NRQ11783.1 hypothetical protein [Aliiroseovarius sp. xm-v-208]
MKTKLFAASLCTAFVLAGCDSYTAPQYQNSAANTITLQQLSSHGSRAGVGEIRLAEGVKARPTCRLAGPLDLGGGDNVASTIKMAIQSELLAGGVFKANATLINIVVTKLEPNSFDGNWQIGLQVSSRKGAGYEIQSLTKFSTSFSAVAACNNTASAFNRALSEAIHIMVSDPRFKSLL